MKKVFGILLCAFIAAGAQSNSTNIAGGLSFAVGEGSEDMNTGLFVSLAPDHRVNEMFTIGGHVDYTWLTVKTNIPDFHGNLHLIDVAFVPKVFAELTDQSKVFFEIDPGAVFSIAQASYGIYSDSDFNTYFAMTYGVGLKFNRVLFGFKFKTAFTEYETTKWINFYVGYTGE